MTIELIQSSIVDDEKEHIVLDEPNRRIIFYQYDEDTLDKKLSIMMEGAPRRDIDKISIYGREEERESLEELPLKEEGKIDGFFNGETAYIYSAFLNPTRKISHFKEQQEAIIESVKDKPQISEKPPLPEGFELRKATMGDVIEMASVFSQVFETYPTPMFEPKYIRKVMKEDTLFSVITHNDQIVSIASADINTKYNNAEITDCATLPKYRGKGFLTHIIFHLEDRLRAKGVPNLFSLTRAQSLGMNHVIAKHGFEYQGTLVQNCNISGSFEDMNIWVKILKDSDHH